MLLSILICIQVFREFEFSQLFCVQKLVSQKGTVTHRVASSASNKFLLLPNSTKQDKGAEHWGYHQCRLLLTSKHWATVFSSSRCSSLSECFLQLWRNSISTSHCLLAYLLPLMVTSLPNNPWTPTDCCRCVFILSFSGWERTDSSKGDS